MSAPAAAADWTFFPTYDFKGTILASSGISGVMRRGDGGCIWIVDNAGAFYLVLWLNAYRLERGGPDWLVVDQAGHPVAWEGAAIKLAGGEWNAVDIKVPGKSARAVVADLIGQEVPEQCASGRYWKAGGLLSGG